MKNKAASYVLQHAIVFDEVKCHLYLKSKVNSKELCNNHFPSACGAVMYTNTRHTADLYFLTPLSASILEEK